MKQITKGVDLRTQEAKYAFKFCQFLQQGYKLNMQGQGEVSIEFDEWVNKNVPATVNWQKTEDIVYKILAFNGYKNFFFALEETKKERFK